MHQVRQGLHPELDPHSAPQNPHKRASPRVQPRLPRCLWSIPEKLCVRQGVVNKPFPPSVSKITLETCAHGGEKRQPQQIIKVTLKDPCSYISSVLPLHSLWACNPSTQPLRGKASHMENPHDTSVQDESTHHGKTSSFSVMRIPFKVLLAQKTTVQNWKIKIGPVKTILRFKAACCKQTPLGQHLAITYFSKRGTVETKTALGHAAQTSSRDDKLYMWSLVACQSYRNLGLCWSISNQRFLALPERGYVHQSTVPKDCNKCRWLYPHHWDKSYWNGNNDSKPFSPFSKSLKHYGTPKCISPQASTWLYTVF